MSAAGAGIRRPPLARRLLRAVLGATLATLLGFLGIILAALLASMWFILVGGERGSLLSVVAVTGLMAFMVGVPPALVLGMPGWLIAESAGFLNRRSGALAGALVGLLISIISPPLIVVLPFIGALAGVLAVHLTNRLVPPHPRARPPDAATG